MRVPDTGQRESALRPLPTWTAQDDRRAFRHSPHLGQWRLRQRLSELVRESLDGAGPNPRVVEVGAGHGHYCGELLAAGARVTLVEMVPTAWHSASQRWAGNDRFDAVLDRDGHLRDAPAGCDLVLVLSVLHHLPDYLSLLSTAMQHLAPGGSLVTVQDPLYYPRLDAVTRRVDRLAYLTWRVGQGEVTAGVRALGRRVRGRYPTTSQGQLTYYHVVRQGVDEQAVVERVRPHFGEVELFGYWSNHLGVVAPVAERAGLHNTFALRARGFSG